MARSSRTPRTTAELLRALDDHQFLLRQSLRGLRESPAYIKTLATELRTLVCIASGTEGLLWRLVNELSVSDLVALHAAGSVNRDHPLVQGLAFAFARMFRAGEGPPQLPPGWHSLRDIIKHNEAVFIASTPDRVFTHELLIGAIAGQMGSAHEAEGLDHTLVRLNQILVNQTQPYVSILAFDGELTLQIGERVLDHSEKHCGFRRASRPHGEGDVTLVLRLGLRQILAGRVPVCTFRFPISEVEITCLAGPQSTVFRAVKRGKLAYELLAAYPPGWQLNTDALFALSYSSQTRKARTITNGTVQGLVVDCNLGWLEAAELGQPETHDKGRDGLVYIQTILTYARLLSSSDCSGLLGLSPDLQELMLRERPQSPFPP